MASLPPQEIKALSRIMDELDYYQILNLERDATTSQVREAFYASSRTFHPDANRNLDPEAFAECSAIAKRVTEGYCVLRHSRKRRAYDSKLAEDAGNRMQLAEAKAAEKRGGDDTRRATTDQGRQYHQKASAAMGQSDWSTARNNLQMALTFEPKNEFLKQELETVKAKLEAEKKSQQS